MALLLWPGNQTGAHLRKEDREAGGGGPGQGGPRPGEDGRALREEAAQQRGHSASCRVSTVLGARTCAGTRGARHGWGEHGEATELQRTPSSF